MSRIGNRVIKVESGVNVEIAKDNVKVSGPLGTMNIPYDETILSVKNENNEITVSRKNEEKFSKMIHGTVNANIANAVIGVSKGHTKSLKIVGVGYKAALKGNAVELYLGHSHSILIDIPQGIKLTCPSATEITITGYDKAAVGTLAEKIRSKRPPEPYKGKGVLYTNEHIIRKVGKTADSKK